MGSNLSFPAKLLQKILIGVKSFYSLNFPPQKKKNNDNVRC